MLYSKGKVQSQKTVNEQNYSWKSSYLPWSSRYRCSISCKVQHNQFRSSERTDRHGLFRWVPDKVVGLYLKATVSECAVCRPGIFTLGHTPRGPWDWDTPTPREEWGSLLCLRLGLDTSWWGYDGSPGIHTVLILLLSTEQEELNLCAMTCVMALSLAQVALWWWLCNVLEITVIVPWHCRCSDVQKCEPVSETKWIVCSLGESWTERRSICAWFKNWKEFSCLEITKLVGLVVFLLDPWKPSDSYGIDLRTLCPLVWRRWFQSHFPELSRDGNLCPLGLCSRSYSGHHNERLHHSHQNWQPWKEHSLKVCVPGPLPPLTGLGPLLCRGQIAKAGQEGSKTQRCAENYFQGRSFSVFHAASVSLSRVFLVRSLG